MIMLKLFLGNHDVNNENDPIENHEWLANKIHYFRVCVCIFALTISSSMQ